jgi:DNA-binding transcriptional ArsR family regulator
MRKAKKEKNMGALKITSEEGKDQYQKTGMEPASKDLVARARGATSQLKAMAHESRLAILFHLYNGSKSVSELEQLLDMRQPAVSQQLARLRSDQMVATERRGKQVYYSIISKDAFVIVELLHRLYGQKPAT